MYSEAGPVGPAGAGVGGTWLGRTGDGQDHPPGPVGHPAGASLSFPCKCRLWALMARIDLIL